MSPGRDKRISSPQNLPQWPWYPRSVSHSVGKNMWTFAVRPSVYDHGVRKNSFTFLVNDQLDSHFFSTYLFQFSTCFAQPRAHHQENQLHKYKIWYMSHCVGDRFVCRPPTCCTPARGCSKHVEN